MTHTVEQALELRDAVRRYKKVLQVGPNGTGNDSYWEAHEAIKGGRIGKVTWAHGSFNRNARVCLFNTHQKIDPTAGPDKPGEDYIDWDMWLGHEWGLAPKIPWNPEHFFRFRKYWPYNGGVATDLLYHKLAPLLLAIAGPNGEYPWRVNASGGLYIEKDGRESGCGAGRESSEAHGRRSRPRWPRRAPRRRQELRPRHRRIARQGQDHQQVPRTRLRGGREQGPRARPAQEPLRHRHRKRLGADLPHPAGPQGTAGRAEEAGLGGQDGLSRPRRLSSRREDSGRGRPVHCPPRERLPPIRDVPL